MEYLGHDQGDLKPETRAGVCVPLALNHIYRGVSPGCFVFRFHSLTIRWLLTSSRDFQASLKLFGDNNYTFFFWGGGGGGEGVSSVWFKPSCAGVSGGIGDEVRYDFIWPRGKRPTE